MCHCTVRQYSTGSYSLNMLLMWMRKHLAVTTQAFWRVSVISVVACCVLTVSELKWHSWLVLLHHFIFNDVVCSHSTQSCLHLDCHDSTVPTHRMSHHHRCFSGLRFPLHYCFVYQRQSWLWLIPWYLQMSIKTLINQAPTPDIPIPYSKCKSPLLRLLQIRCSLYCNCVRQKTDPFL